MIGAASTGTGFRALGSYLIEKDPSRVEWAETRNTMATEPREAWAEMEREVALSNSRVKQPMYHVAISFDPTDQPTDAEVREAADRTLRDLGMGTHQAIMVRHNDTGHAHVHIMVNRVGPEGEVWSTSFSDRRLRASLEVQERELGVRWTGQNAEMIARANRAFEQAADRPAVRELIGREPVATTTGPARDRGFAAEVRGSSLADFKGASSWSDLEARLAARGLTIERRGQGAVVTDGEREAKLSSVSRSVTRGKLEARLGPLAEHQSAKERSPSQSLARLAAPAGVARMGTSAASARRAPVSLLSRRRAAAAVGKVGRRLQPVSIRGAAGRALRGEADQDPETRAAQRAARLTLGVARASLASRRAVAAKPAVQRAAPPGRAERMTLERLRGLVRAKERARVERVVALVQRAHSYERTAASLGVATRYQGQVEGTVALARQASATTRALDVHLGHIYERPAEARARMLGYADKAGPEKVSQLLAREPERFGKMVAPPSGGGRPEPPAQSRLGKLFSKPTAAVPDHAAALAQRVQEAGPLVTSAHQARTQATEAVRSLGLGTGAARPIKGAELSQAVERRVGRLRATAELGMSRVPGSRAASDQLARAVRGLTPRQQAQVVSRVGRAGLGTVSRSLSVAKAVVRGMQR